ncbi:LSME1 protein, partial [Thalassarche chlororhynchos]|nr:LSME1 protein [Thalassarche chlororhynchos]
MERPSLEINLPDIHEEGKLYVVDSLNNLNKLNVCPDGSQHALVNKGSLISILSSICKVLWLLLGLFFVTYIFFIFFFKLGDSVDLIPSVKYIKIIFHIQTRNKMDQISSRLISEKKNIEELKKMNNMILKHLNQSGIKE